MSKKLKILQNVKVSSPCHNKNFSTNSEPTENGWYCHECQKEVHDFSRYSSKKIAKLLEQNEGSICALIKRRADGTIITNEPQSYPKSILASGLILASTALINNTAYAQDPDTNSSPAQAVESQETLGKIAPMQNVKDIGPEATVSLGMVAPIENKDNKNQSCDSASSSSSSAPAERGRVAIDQVGNRNIERGEVSLEPANKDGK